MTRGTGDLKLKRRGSYWWVFGTYFGRRIRQTTRQTDRRVAEEVRDALKERIRHEALYGKKPDVTFRQAAEAYVADGKDADEQQRRAKRLCKPKRSLVGMFSDMPLREIRPGHIESAGKRLYPHPCKPQTREREVLKVMRAVINYGADRGWCERLSIPSSQREKPAPPKKKVPVDKAWVDAFMQQAVRDGLPHLAALAAFMFTTAARVGEATRLRWRDLDLDSESPTARIEMRKGGDWVRKADLISPTVAAIVSIPSNRKPDDRVFGYSSRGSVSKIWKKTAARAGLQELTPHSCRHGFATEALRAGVDPATIARQGGWRSAQIVISTYVHPNDDINVAELIFGTKLTRPELASVANNSKRRRKPV